MPRSRTTLFIVLAVVAVLVAGGAIGFFAWKNRSGGGQVEGMTYCGLGFAASLASKSNSNSIGLKGEKLRRWIAQGPNASIAA